MQEMPFKDSRKQSRYRQWFLTQIGKCMPLRKHAYSNTLKILLLKKKKKKKKIKIKIFR